mmetsp:Transcript_6440/g.40248  ORF Transcript_6440/g.40248 Transcript_6440/m.40248 type:complete len:474 (+) Transcript_6440:331-1752(+)
MAHDEEVVGYQLGTKLGEGLVARVYAAQKSGVEDSQGQASHEEGKISRQDSDWAVKVARNDAKGAVEALHRESKVLERLRGVPGVAQSVESGSGYLVMPVYGTNAAEIRRRSKNGRLEGEQVVALGRGMLRCLKYLHESGWIHRDVKPANFVLRMQGNSKISQQPTNGTSISGQHTSNEDRGKEFQHEATQMIRGIGITANQGSRPVGEVLERKEEVGGKCLGSDGASDMILLDMGLAKRYAHSNGKHIAPRMAVGFRGTVAYASPRAHDGEDLSRKDDLISLFFSLVELAEGKLPWRGLEEDAIGLTKKNFLASKRNELTPQSGALLHRFLQLVEEMSFRSTPDYDLLEQALLQGLKEEQESKQNGKDIAMKNLGQQTVGMAVLRQTDQILNEIAEVAVQAQAGSPDAVEFLQQLILAYDTFKSKIGSNCCVQPVQNGSERMDGTSRKRKTYEDPGFRVTPCNFSMPPEGLG